MVDTNEIFRKLGSGARFDDRGCFSPSKRKQPGKENESEKVKAKVEALDFFGCSKHSSENEMSPVKEGNAIVWEDNSNFPDSISESEEESYADSRSGKKKKSSFKPEKIAALRKEKMNELRNSHHIHVKGADVPDPLKIFSDLTSRFKCSKHMMKNLEDAGYENPTPVQMQAIPLMLNQREVLVCAPTGSGKTLAFIIPVLHCLKKPAKSGIRGLVIAPTRELVNQIYREFSRINVGRGLRINVLTKSRSSSIKRSKSFYENIDILITTPNRLVHLLNKDSPEIELNTVEWLVLDEGDKLFEEGKSGFREQIASVITSCDHPKLTRALFSATLANQVEDWCSLHLNNFVRVTVGVRNSATENVNQELCFTGQESGKLIAMRDVLRKAFDPPILIFVQSKDRAKELFNELIYDGINVDVIHADRTQLQRENVVKQFRSGKIWVLIATELMGRGIDFKGINLVVNYDFPPSAVSYIHRIGRTGRAGRSGTAITFFTEDDIVNLKSIANVMQSSGCEIPAWISKLHMPSRSKKKQLAAAPLKRDGISAPSSFRKRESKRKREIISASKQRITEKADADS